MMWLAVLFLVVVVVKGQNESKSWPAFVFLLSFFFFFFFSFSFLCVWPCLITCRSHARTFSLDVTNTLFNQSFAPAQVPALFGASIAVFAIASTLFFFVHAAMQSEDDEDDSAMTQAIELEKLDQR